MAETIEGLSIRLDLDTIGLNRGLAGLKDKLKNVNSEMKANMSAFEQGDRSIERYETNLKGLNKKLEVQQAITREAKKEYEKMVEQYGEGSRQAEKAARSYNDQVAALNNLQWHIGRVSSELEDIREELRVSESAWSRFGDALDGAGNRLTAIGDRMKTVGQNMATYVTAPLAGLGLGLTTLATNFDSSSVKIQNSLGLTSKEAKNLTNISRNIFKDGFGESTEDIETALIRTRQNIKGLNDEELEKVTKKAMVLAETFDGDVNEVTRATDNLMQGFGVSADKAFDLMANGAQDGLNFSDELFDNLSEYAPLFGKMGFSADEYFQMLKQGADVGVYNLDYINDAMKEFQIRMKDGSSGTSDAMGELSKGTQKLWKNFLSGKGTVKDVHNAVIKELEGMKNQTKANEIGVGLYGTKWEDLEADAMYALGGIGGELENVDGTMDKMSENVEQSFGARFKSVWRETQSALMPFGETLLGFAERILPKVSTGIEKVANFIKNLSPAVQSASVIFAVLVAALGPVIAIGGMFVGMIGNIITALGPLTAKIADAGGLLKWLRGGLTALTGPVGIVIGVIALLVTGFITLYRNSETFRTGVQNLIVKVKELAQNALKALQPAIDAVVQFFKDQLAVIKKFWDENGATIMEALSNIYNFIKDIFQNKILPVIQFVMPFILSIIKSVWNNIKGVISGAIKIIMGVIKVFAGLFTGDFKKMWEGVKQIFRGAIQFVWNFIQLHFIGRIVKGIGGFVKSIGSKLKSGWSSAIDGIKSFVGKAKGWFDDLLTKGREKFNDLVSAAKALPGKIGQGIKNAAGKVGDGIKAVSNRMLRGLGKGVNGVIGGVNWVLGKIGVDKKVPKWEVPQYAKGTGGHPGGLAVVGDGRGSNAGSELIQTPDGKTMLSPSTSTLVNLPKGTQVLSAKETKALLGLIPHYAQGTGWFSKLKDKAFDVWSYITDPSKLFNKALEMFGVEAPSFPGVLKDMGKGLFKKAKDALKEFLKGKIGDFGSSVPSAGSGVQRWAGLAARALMIEGQYSKANLERLLYQMQTESGGNPRAINLWDINAKRGTPSMGLLQTIMPTYQAYKHPQFDKGPYDPMSNILASIRYAMARYGSLTRAYRGVGYASGGLINNDGLYRLAEGGFPEFVIPTDPKRRTDAMKLLALAGKKIQGNKRPNQLPGMVNSGNNGSMEIVIDKLNQQVQLLTELVLSSRNIENKPVLSEGDIGRAYERYDAGQAIKHKIFKGRGPY